MNNVEASRHLSRLMDVDLVIKGKGNLYSATTVAIFVTEMSKHLEFVLDNRDFFLTHNFTCFPLILEHIGALSHTAFLSGIFKVFEEVKNISNEADEFIYVYSTSPMRDVIQPNIEKAKRGLDVRIIYLKGVEPPEEYKGTGVKIRFHPSLTCAMKMNEKKGGIAFCTLDGVADFNQILMGDSDGFIGYLKRVFEHLWNESA